MHRPRNERVARAARPRLLSLGRVDAPQPHAHLARADEHGQRVAIGDADDALLAQGRSRNVAISIQSYALAPLILAHTDAVCTLPARFLSQFEQQRDLLDPALELANIRLGLAWHPRNQHDAGHPLYDYP